MRTKSLVFLLLSLCLLLACGPTETTEAPETETESEDSIVETARGIHERVITLDTHVDIPFNYATEEVDPGVRGDFKVDLPKMEEGGLNAAFFIVYVGQTERTPENYEKAQQDAMTKFDAIHRMSDEMYPERIEFAYTADDVVRIHESGKLVATIGIENGYVIGKDLSLLEKYHGLGARYIRSLTAGITTSPIPRRPASV